MDFGRTAAVITVGDEVVEGRVVNDNAAWLAAELARRGIWTRLALAVSDDERLIAELLDVALRSVDTVIVCGGLGFTPDDITRRAVAAGLGREVRVDGDVAQQVRQTCPWATEDIVQAVATVPVGALAVVSDCGGVPGFSIDNVHVLPGSPREMRSMFPLLALPGDREIVTAVLSCDTTEDRLLDALREFDAAFPDVRLGSYPMYEGPVPRVTLVLAGRSIESLGRAQGWWAERISD